MINRIVVGSDGSEQAQQAAAFAADLARQTGAEVVLVHVVGQFPPAIASTGGYMMYVPQQIIDESRDELERRVQTEFSAPLVQAGVRWRAEIRDGWAPRVIAEVAGEVDAQLIVVGTRGLHALGEMFLGSTSHALTHHAKVPLIVVPAVNAHRAHGHKLATAAV
ncbi:MAG: universal stress protein [Candidatus Dormibacteraeota bacterium]|nr:universal stress protein [Candidatus Dormibacteraeota bacterium]